MIISVFDFLWKSFFIFHPFLKLKCVHVCAFIHSCVRACICVCVCGGVKGIVHAITCLRRTEEEDDFVGLVLSFHLYIVTGHQTQVTRLAWQAVYLLSILLSPFLPDQKAPDELSQSCLAAVFLSVFAILWSRVPARSSANVMRIPLNGTQHFLE